MKYGYNATNWFEAYKPSDIPSLNEMGGFIHRFRYDKGSTALQFIDMNNLLSIKSPIIFTIAFDKTVESNIAEMTTLINAGVAIIAVEFGNEEYASKNFNFDFAAYKAAFLPYQAAIKAAFPFMPCSVFIAPNIGLNNHIKWNNDVKDYLSTAPLEDGISLHIYFDEKQVSGFKDFPQPRVVTGYDASLDTYFNNLYEDAKDSGLFASMKSYTDTNFAGRKVYITEFGYSNTGDLNNTLAYNMSMWREWNENKFDYFLQHNGISPTDTGFITPAKNQDIFPRGENVKRLPYFTYKLFNEIQDKKIPYVEGFLITSDGVENFYFVNNTENDITPIVNMYPSLEILSQKTRYIQGVYSYSSSGSCPFMASGSTKSYDINGIKEQQVLVLPKKSFGYIQIQTGIKLEINNPPVANAGEDRTIYVGEPTILSGAKSTDDGVIVSYRWLNSTGTQVSTNVNYTITPTVAGVYTYYLEVVDDKGLKSTDVVEITAKDKGKPKFWCKVFPRLCKLLILGLLFTSCQKEIVVEEEIQYKTSAIITSPYYPSLESCDSVDWHGYPDQEGDQFLHPQEVIDCGKDHLVVFDHITTRKLLNAFDVRTLCDIDLWIQNPTTKKVVRFRDIYNWTDLNGNPLFNLDYEIYNIWGITTPTTFKLKSTISTTGEDVSFGHDSVTLQMTGIDTVSYYD